MGKAIQTVDRAIPGSKPRLPTARQSSTELAGKGEFSNQTEVKENQMSRF